MASKSHSKLVESTYGLKKYFTATCYQNTEKISIPQNITQYALRGISRNIPRGIPRGVPSLPFPVQAFKDSHYISIKKHDFKTILIILKILKLSEIVPETNVSEQLQVFSKSQSFFN